MNRLAGALARVLPPIAALPALSPLAAAEEHPHGIALHWVRDQGAESCVSGQTLNRELERLVVEPATAASELSIEGFVRREIEPARWVARLRLLDREGRTTGVRTVESSAPECAALTSSILLVLAWLIDSQLETTPAPTAAPISVPAQLAKPVEAAPAHAPVDAAPAHAPKRWAIEPSLALGVAFGVNPSASVGPSLELRLITPWRIALALAGQYWPADRVALEQPAVPGSGVEFRAVQASLALCVPLLPPSAWSLAGCWGGVLGSRFARADGLADPRNLARIYGGAINTLRLAYNLSAHWSLALDATGAAFGREDRFVYEDAAGETRELYRPPPFGGWCTLGVAARF